MSMPRFSAIVRNVPLTRADADDAFRLAFASSGLDVTYFEKGALSPVVMRGPALDLGDDGVIVGTLFDRVSMRLVTTIGPEERKRIANEGPRGLVERYWGGYVAFLVQADGGVLVLRAPLGELPCMYAPTNDGLIVASDIDMACRAGLPRPKIAWDRIRHELVTRDMHWPQTCLERVTDLTGGSCLKIGPGTFEVTEFWTPWTFVSEKKRITDPSEAAELVGAVTRACVNTRASDFEKVVLMLSGGIDSSIVAACLASSGTEVAALNLVSRDAVGDERHYARRVAQWLDIPLVEPLRDATRIDVTRSGAAGLCRPNLRLFMQESIRLVEEHATENGATAIFGGGGGDNVFCALQSSSPAADRLRTTGLGMEFLQTALDISRLAPASLRAVVTDAVRRAWLGKPPLTPFRDTSFMRGDACRDIEHDGTHPWLDLPKGALPGSAAFVRLIASARSFVEAFDPGRPVQRAAPLLAQPLVETCLRVPSWLWFEDGRSRVIARKAFAKSLPPEIMARRSKGTPDGFIAEIYERHRQTIREFLGDGVLVRHGIIDREALLKVLDRPSPARGNEYDRVLRLVDVEAWIQARQ